MAKSELLSVLTVTEAQRLMTRGNAVQCRFCGDLIQIDDLFIRKARRGRYGESTVYYHKDCWEATLH